MARPQSPRQALIYSAGFSIASSIGMTVRYIIDHDSIPAALTEGAWLLILVFPSLFAVLYLASRVRRSRGDSKVTPEA